MLQLSIPEIESRTLINNMDEFRRLNVSLNEEQYFKNSNLSLTHTRNSMHIESAKQEMYINILCNLLDESVHYNDSKKVMFK